MIFVKLHILSFCQSINLIRFMLSMSACHPFLFFVNPFHPYMYPSCISTPSNSSLRLPLYPIPQTHQSVGHSTKDDKGPEGIKRWSRDSSKKRKGRGKAGKILLFHEKLSPFCPNPWDHGSFWMTKRQTEMKNWWMNEWINKWMMWGEDKPDAEEKRRVLSVASLLSLCLPQETYLSADYTCTVIYIYIYIKYNKV